MMPGVHPTSKNAANTPTRKIRMPTYSLWRALAEVIGRKIRYSRDLEHLNGMSDHQLRDIGITRDQIDTALRRRRRAFPPPRI